MTDKKEQSLAIDQPQRQEPNHPILAMIQTAAENPQTDVDKLERMFALYERQLNRDAETEFNRAMNKAQAALRRVAADASNPQTHSKYASYAALDRALRPVYTDHGFALSFDTEDSDKPEHVRVVCYASHQAGHTRRYRADMPADGKGAKGGDVMTKTHASGAAMSYGMRYLLKLIFNVAIGEDDNDGNGPSGMIDDDRLADMIALKDELGDRLKPDNFRNWLRDSIGAKDGRMENIPAGKVAVVFRKMEKFRKAAQTGDSE